MRILCSLLALTLACGDDDTTVTDAGTTDAGSTEDGGAPDGGDLGRAVTLNAGDAIAEVDERYISVAVDTAQVVGGEFWAEDGSVGTVGGMEVPPYDFERPRLRALASELAPSILRIGGSDADRVFYDFEEPPLGEAPEGYEYVFTREQYDGVFEFAEAVGFDVMFTVNGGPATRDESFAWQPDNARVLFEYTVAQGYEVTLWELINEPNAFRAIHGLDQDLMATQLAADYEVFDALLEEVIPDGRIGGPSVAWWPVLGELDPLFDDFLAAGGGDHLDVMTWHYYPQQSVRCPVAARRAEQDTMLQPRNLDEVTRWAADVEEQTEAATSATEVWLGESGNAQCGGQPDVSDAFAGSFWWLDQLGLLATRGQKVTVRQTLSGSNYGVLDEATLDPNPDYWASVLWRRLMGTEVLEVLGNEDRMLRAYAHCGAEGGVTWVLLNLSQEEAVEVDLGEGAQERWVVTAEGLDARVVALNGVELEDDEGTLPPMEGDAGEGALSLEPTTYAFVHQPGATCP